MKTWIATTAALLLTSNVALADNCRPGFDTVEDAVIASLNSANPESITANRMVMGEVYQINDRYYTSEDSLPRDRDSGGVRLHHPAGAKTAALFRTSANHNDNLDNGRIHSLDRRASLRYDVNYYVADASGDLFVAEPGELHYERVSDERGNTQVATRINDAVIVAAMIADGC